MRAPDGRQPPRNFKPGDWYCDKCGCHNFANRYECYQCREPKKEGGVPGAPAGGPPGGYGTYYGGGYGGGGYPAGGGGGGGYGEGRASCCSGFVASTVCRWRALLRDALTGVVRCAPQTAATAGGTATVGTRDLRDRRQAWRAAQWRRRAQWCRGATQVVW